MSIRFDCSHLRSSGRGHRRMERNRDTIIQHRESREELHEENRRLREDLAHSRAQCRKLEDELADMDILVEESVITEASLALAYDNVRQSILELMNFLEYQSTVDAQKSFERLRSLNTFDTSLTRSLSQMHSVFASKLFNIVRSCTESDFCANTCYWGGDYSNFEIQNSVPNGFLNVQNKMANIAFELAQASGGQNTTSSTDLKVSPKDIKDMQSFFRLRSDTVKLKALIERHHTLPRNILLERSNCISEQVSKEFFDSTKQQISPRSALATSMGNDSKTESYIWIFHSSTSKDSDHSQKCWRTFNLKIRKCLDTMQHLLFNMRSSRANYVFESLGRRTFDPDPKKSEINHMLKELLQYCTNGETVNDRRKVVLCVFPALVKYGDDFGKDFWSMKGLIKADIVVDQ